MWIFLDITPLLDRQEQTQEQTHINLQRTILNLLDVLPSREIAVCAPSNTDARQCSWNLGSKNGPTEQCWGADRA